MNNLIDLIFITIAVVVASGITGYFAGRRLGYLEIIALEKREALRYPKFNPIPRPDFKAVCEEPNVETQTRDNRPCPPTVKLMPRQITPKPHHQ